MQFGNSEIRVLFFFFNPIFPIKIVDRIVWLLQRLWIRHSLCTYYTWFFWQPLSESGCWVVKFGEPDLFMRWRVKGSSYNQKLFICDCQWKILNCSMILWSGKYFPGIKKHMLELLYIFTFISAFLASLLILLTYCIRTRKSAKMWRNLDYFLLF